MALSVKEFLARDPKNQPGPHNRCTQPDCQNQASQNHTIDKQPVCEDCYFDAIGEIIEAHPIGRIMPHGGCH